ncbi:hypothetical protein SIN8267_00706 [Sinobacterium norvegicum]|uniref:Uncharacterized protein n=1 Tax=Sinobacterium norvegicum TaxID=1641715 RepID=A0ABN8EGZ1_9GAMM|nr:hypothetical protein [Sinobacterium norvegicum]CAH0990612.1 hypothetical protein SIN8267_00706 [Sinobacterium norvegicum]
MTKPISEQAIQALFSDLTTIEKYLYSGDLEGALIHLSHAKKVAEQNINRLAVEERFNALFDSHST